MRQRTAFFALLLAALATLASGRALTAAELTMEQKIQSALVEKLGADAKTISVAFSDGKAVLSGKVAEDSTQEIAKEVALWVPGVTGVDSKIEAANERMVGGGKLIAEQKDLGTESGVKDVLRREVGKLAGGLEVEACNGVVSVRGNVPDKASHEQVLGLASKVVDVKKVVDLLRITG
jgi:osmotically-inducible protein OsmY